MATRMTYHPALKRKVYNNFSSDYGTKDGLKIRKLTLDVNFQDNQTKVQKLSLGTPSPCCSTKIILLIGGSGNGKTTLINAIVNFILGVDFEDDFRFILKGESMSQSQSQSDAQTAYITEYVFNYQSGMPFDYNYILIDTPGYGDPRGVRKDKDMMDQLENFFNQRDMINYVSAVGMVTPASATRLTPTQGYIFNGLSLMFGRDIMDKICILSTFADTTDPPILEALQDADIHYNGFYKFNNSAIYANNKMSNSRPESSVDMATHINRSYWEMGYESLRQFFLNLGQNPSASLSLTKEVLRERKNLESALIEVQSQIPLGLSKLAVLHQEREMLSRIKIDVRACANYEEEIEVPKTEVIENSSEESDLGSFGLNYSPKFGMIGIGFSWSKKRKSSTRVTIRWFKEKRTVKELFQRYNLAVSNCEDKEAIVHKMKGDIENFSKDLIKLIKKAKISVERLQEIALKPNPISVMEYIDLLIQSEKMERSYNFKKRIEMLEFLKREDLDFFGHHESSLEHYFRRMRTDDELAVYHSKLSFD